MPVMLFVLLMGGQGTSMTGKNPWEIRSYLPSVISRDKPQPRFDIYFVSSFSEEEFLA